MGRDNHPRERQARALARKKAKRGSYDRILIVCEGRKTEPLYFDGIRRYFRLQTANVQVMNSDYGTTPMQIAEYALDKFLETKGWEQVYCVFDRDDHQNYYEALRLVSSLDKKYRNDLNCQVKFKAIPSVPSFEFWLLLHFECVRRETHRDEAMRMLRRYLTDYAKGQGDYFQRTQDRLDTALENAEILAEDRKRYNDENPFTAVAELVEILITLGRKR